MVGLAIDGIDDTVGMFQQVQDVFSDGNAVYIVGTNVAYAAYVEFGTSRMKAQPYLFRAAREVWANPTRYLESPSTINDTVAQLGLAIEKKAKEYAPVDTGRLRASIETERIR